MARSKGNGRKKSSKQAIKAKNTYNHKASESLYGSPRKSMLKFNPDLYGSPKKAILKQKNAKGKAKTTKKGSKKSNAKSSSKNKTKQEKTSTSTARSAQMNNRKRSQKNAPRVNNSVRKFKLQMPSVGPNAPPAPWWKYSPPFSLSSLVKGSTGTIYSSKKEATKILDTISVNVDAIRQLDKELEAFGRYVRLIPLECQARDHLIYTIQQAAGDLFGIQPSDCKIFGSYAARPVCTFESDVDLAIFGVVEPDSSGSGEEEEEDDSEEGSLPSPKLVKNHPNRKKQEKILKWKFAINENEQIHQKDKEGEVKAKPKQQEEKTIEAIEAYKPQNQEGEIGVTEEDSPLFMIDRVGEPESNDNHPLLDNNLKETGTSAVGICSSQFEDAAEGNQVIIEDVENTKSDKDVSSQFSDAPEGESTVVMAAEETRTSNPVIGRDDFLAKNQTSCCTEDSIYKDNDSQGSDEDNVDKLEGLKSSERCVKNTDDDHGFRGFRTLNLPGADDTHDGGNFGSISREKDDDSDYSEEEEMITKPRSHSVISLSSSTTCSDNETWDESGMEVSFITAPSQSSAARRSRASVVGPTGETRTCVVRALNTLSRRIRKFNFNTQVFVRKHARVPIINLETCFGYECDIALGGHNGTDTSAYASNQISKSCSFAPVVLALKVILSQHGLDKPFTGGLGSFKLYVLVANHIERHLALGGSDNPGEIFFMFLFRYGHVNGFENIISSARTPLSQLMVIESKDGGSADMGGVFQVENCVRVFQECWRLLRSKLKQKVNPKHSILRFIVEADSLQRKRTLCSKKASLIERFATSSIRKQRLYYQIDTKMALLQRNGRDSATDSATRLQSRQPEAANTRADFDTDEEAEQINAGYGVTTKPKDSSKRKLNKNSKKSKIQGIQKRRKLEVQAATKTPGSDVKSSTKKVTMFQALGRPVEKMCLSTGRVLERFETGWAAAKDASTAKSVNKKLFKVLTGSFKGNQRVYNGYFWRWEGSNHVPR